MQTDSAREWGPSVSEAGWLIQCISRAEECEVDIKDDVADVMYRVD